jgi:hypothetical protein
MRTRRSLAEVFTAGKNQNPKVGFGSDLCENKLYFVKFHLEKALARTGK